MLHETWSKFPWVKNEMGQFSAGKAEAGRNWQSLMEPSFRISATIGQKVALIEPHSWRGRSDCYYAVKQYDHAGSTYRYRSDQQSNLVWSGYDIDTPLLGRVRSSATCSSLSWLLPPMGMHAACLLLEHIGGSSGGELLSGQKRAGRKGSSSRSFKKRRSTDWLCDHI